MGPTWRRKGWVFGMMEIKGDRRRPILRMVKNRSRATLIPILQRHVRPGSTVVSDCWRAYVRSLNGLGYNHLTVNHSENFVDPTSGCHTQHIERAWQTIKGQVWRLRGNRTKILLKDHLKFIEWTFWLGKENKRGIFAQLVEDIKSVHKVKYAK